MIYLKLNIYFIYKSLHRMLGLVSDRSVYFQTFCCGRGIRHRDCVLHHKWTEGNECSACWKIWDFKQNAGKCEYFICFLNNFSNRTIILKFFLSWSNTKLARFNGPLEDSSILFLLRFTFEDIWQNCICVLGFDMNIEFWIDKKT